MRLPIGRLAAGVASHHWLCPQAKSVITLAGKCCNRYQEELAQGSLLEGALPLGTPEKLHGGGSPATPVPQTFIPYSETQRHGVKTSTARRVKRSCSPKTLK